MTNSVDVGMTAQSRGAVAARFAVVLLALGTVVVGCSTNPKYFVFPEHRYARHKDNLLHGIFPGWDLNITIESPQYYRKAEYETGRDFKHYLITQAVCLSDSISVANLHAPYGFIKMPNHTESVLVDSAMLWLYPGNSKTVVYVDSSRYREQRHMYLPGVNAKSYGFMMPPKTDSLRLVLTARLVDKDSRVLDTAHVDTILYGQVKFKEDY